MDQLHRIAVDAMGGDYAPGAIVEGCIKAMNENNSLHLILVGDEAKIKRELEKYSFDTNRLDIVHTTEIIENCEAPVMAIRRKKDSSIVVGMNLVKKGDAKAFVSAGSTGALIAGGTFIVGRIKGVERPALAPLIPTQNGFSLLIDAGANVDCKASFLVQFAKMGQIYTNKVLGIATPKVGIINIGAEEGKGNALVKEAYTLLKEDEGVNFIGNIEARDVPLGEADIMVCDGFTGNVVLKTMEGLGKFMFKTLKKEIFSSLKGKIGGLLLKPVFRKIHKQFDSSEVGGAALLGVNGLVVKAHGNSNAKAIVSALTQASLFIEKDVTKLMVEEFTVKK